jgi:hypothetical protein
MPLSIVQVAPLSVMVTGAFDGGFGYNWRGIYSAQHRRGEN